MSAKLLIMSAKLIIMSAKLLSMSATPHVMLKAPCKAQCVHCALWRSSAIKGYIINSLRLQVRLKESEYNFGKMTHC